MPRTTASRRQSRASGHFVGRVAEQRLFRSVLIQLAGLRDRRDEQLTEEELSYPQLFLVAAEGGMGKTTLLRRFEAIVAENREGANARALYLDWERHTPVSDPDHMMRVLHDALCKAGFEDELKPYREAIDKRTEARKKAADAEEKYKSVLAGAAGWGVQIASHGVVGRDTAATGLRAGAEATQDVLAFIRKKLSDEEWQLYDDPHALTETFIRSVGTIATAKRPLVLLLDTYEVADQCDKWVRERALERLDEYPRLIFVIAGREGQPFIRRYEDVFEPGLLAPIMLDTFARPDIVAYLQQCGLATPDDALVDRLQGLSRGIPLALEGWFNLYQKQVELPPPDPAAPTTRQAIVRRMTDRFLRYCNEDDKHLPVAERKQRETTRNRILTLMLLRQTNLDALAAAWQCDVEEAEASLNELADQFSFIFAQEIEREPHALVKQFLREHLRDTPHPPVAVQKAVERLAAHFEQQLRAREQALVPDAPLRRPLWQDERWRETLLDLLNAHCWHDRSGEQAMRLLVPMFVEALEFNREAAVSLLTAAEEFAASWRGEFSRTFGILKAGRTAIEVWFTPRDQMKAILDTLQPPADRWALTPLQRAILHLERSRLLFVPWDIAGRDELPGALAAADEAARLVPADGGELAQSLAGRYKDIGSACLWPGPGQPVASPEAARVLAIAIRLAPKDQNAWYDLGVSYWKLQRYDEAIAAYQHAAALDPILAVPHNGLGNVYHSLQRYDEAIAAYQHAAALDPILAVPHNGLGTAYADLQRYDEAIAAYQHAATLDPNFAAPYLGLGNVYSVLSQIDQARTAYQRAVELDPQDYRSLGALARIARQEGDLEAAATLIAQARSLLTGDDFYNRACQESIAGDVRAAVEALRVALERQEAPIEWARQDPDFVFIRDDPEFRALVGLEDEPS